MPFRIVCIAVLARAIEEDCASSASALSDTDVDRYHKDGYVIVRNLFSAAEAEEFGLVNRVVPADELDAFVDDWASRLAAGPPIALSLSKKMLNNATHVTLAQALEDEARSQSVTLASDDTADAFKAFVEKREPNFKGP